ncbi:MAG: DUF2232 domain-containing protein [Pseudomonadota bacterium]
MPVYTSIRYIDVMGCVSTAIMILLASAWIPIIGPFFGLLTPLPFLYYATKLGPFQGSKVIIITFLIIGLIAKLIGHTHLILFCLEFGLLGLIISWLYRKNLTVGLTIFLSTGFMLLMGLIFLYAIALSKGMGPIELFLGHLQKNLTEMISFYDRVGLNEDKADQIKIIGQTITQALLRVSPSIIIVVTGLTVWLNVIISKPLFILRNLKYPEFGSLDRWKAPEVMVWGLIASGFALFFTGGIVRLIAVNALIVISAIYIFQGLSIVLFILNKYNVGRGMRFLVYFLILFQQIMLLGLFFAGLFDQWLDLRKIHKKREVET